MLVFDSVSFSYDGENWIVKDLSLKIGAGELVGLLGKNGSGKSTIARLANGLLTPNKGRVLLNGTDIRSKESEAKAKVGLVFQNPDNQFIGITVEEDLAFGLENMNVPRQEALQRIEEVSTAIGIKDFLKYPPNLLSGGEKQKIAIASALVLRPSFLILDEVTSLLDPIERSLILGVVIDIARQSKVGVLYVTHNSEELVSMDKVLVLHNGKVVREGPPSSILTDVDFLERSGVSAPLTCILSTRLLEKKLVTKKHVLVETLVNELCSS